MNTPDNVNVLVSPELISLRGARWWRSACLALFVGLMALFCTVPASDAQPSKAGRLQPVQTGKQSAHADRTRNPEVAEQLQPLLH